MRVTICDIDGCGKDVSISGAVVDESSDWYGMTFDLCADHDGIGPLMTQWEAEVLEEEKLGEIE